MNKILKEEYDIESDQYEEDQPENLFTYDPNAQSH